MTSGMAPMDPSEPNGERARPSPRGPQGAPSESRGSGPLDDLIERSRCGDLEAFSDVVVALHSEVRGFAAMMGVAPDWVDDVAQEIFVAVFQSLGRFERGRSFRKWVRGVARNVIRRHEEAEARESKLRQGAVTELVRRRCEKLAEVPGDVVCLGALDKLRRCLARLPERLRSLLKLRYSDGMTSGEIATVVKSKADTVRMTLMRARRLLLECIRSNSQEAGSEA